MNLSCLKCYAFLLLISCLLFLSIACQNGHKEVVSPTNKKNGAKKKKKKKIKKKNKKK